MNTIVLEDTPNGKVAVDVLSKMASNRILFLNGNLHRDKAVDFISTLLYLNSLPTKDSNEITVFLNSYGSDLDSALMITDAISAIESPVKAVVCGHVAGVVPLVMAASNSSRATKNSLIVFGPLGSYADRHQIKSAEKHFKRMDERNKMAMSIMAKKIGKSLKETLALFSTSVYMSPKDALKLGLVDAISKEKR